MKIFYLVTKSERGGAQVHVLDLVRKLQGRIDPIAICGDEGFLTNECRRLGVEVRIVPELVHPIRPLQDARAVYRVASLLRQYRPDVIHGHTGKAGLVARLAAKLAGVPAVYTVHSWSFVSPSRLTKLVATSLERVLRLVGGTVVEVCRFNFKAACEQGVVSPRHHVTIWNGLPDCSERARLNPACLDPANVDPDCPVRIIMTARFAWPKDHTLLLQALAGIDEPWRLTFAGDGPQRTAIERLSKALGLEKQVFFTGDTDRVESLLADSDLFVLSSFSEGLPLSIIEAMRAGLPVVATDAGGVSELVQHGVTGYIVSKHDVEEMRNRLRSLIASPADRYRMGRLGRLRYERDFKLERMAGATLCLYQNVVS